MSDADSASPAPRRGRNAIERRLGARGPRGGAGTVVALGVEQQLVERRRQQHLALHRRDRRGQPLVDRRERLGDRLAGAGARSSAASLTSSR